MIETAPTGLEPILKCVVSVAPRRLDHEALLEAS